MAFELPEGTEIVKVIPLTEFLDLVFVLMRVDLFGDEFAGCQGNSLPDKIADYSILMCVIFLGEFSLLMIEEEVTSRPLSFTYPLFFL